MPIVRDWISADTRLPGAESFRPDLGSLYRRFAVQLDGAVGRSWDRLRALPAHAWRRNNAKPLNLALQGGGTHGAFTWGVLDRLLEDGRFRFDGVSGTSAGAFNAVALTAGLLDGGPAGARVKLETLWRAVSDMAHYSPLRLNHDWSASHVAFDLMTRVLSPYQLNPLNFNPLRDVLERWIDFARLRRRSPVALFISATDVASGAVRIFRAREISVDVVLASACLPFLHQAVKVGRRYYWDGGYSANPAILPLVREGGTDDTLIVQLNPTEEPDLPTNAQDILGRLNSITFNAPLRREIELIERCRALATEGFALGGQLRRRLRRHRFHLIEAAKYTRGLGHASKLNPDWGLLCHLRDGGRAAAETWLKQHFKALGRRSTVDLRAKFL